MWCLYDMERDSWDWVGREHASTLQSGVEAPRLLKRSLPRLYFCCCCVLLCCCCLGHDLMCMVTSHRSLQRTVPETYWCQVTWESRLPATRHTPSPRRRRTLHRRGLQKLYSRNLRTAEYVCRYKGLVKKTVRIFLWSCSAIEESIVHTSPVHKRRAGCKVDFRIWVPPPRGKCEISSKTHPGKDAEQVSTVEPSIREQSRHGTCCCRTTGTQHHTKELDLWGGGSSPV